jgi:transcriptional regulator with XRE-family HTH domain
MTQVESQDQTAYVNWLKRLGKNISNRRRVLGWTQALTAERLGVDFKFYQDLEYGRRPCTTRTLFSIAKGLEISVHDLIPPDCTPWRRGRLPLSEVA